MHSMLTSRVLLEIRAQAGDSDPDLNSSRVLTEVKCNVNVNPPSHLSEDSEA